MKIFTQKMFTLSLFFALFLAACSSTESSNEAAQTTQPARQTTSTTAPQSTDTTAPVVPTTTTEPEPLPPLESLTESLCKTDFPESNTVEWAYCILLPEPVSLERAYKLDFFATSWNSPASTGSIYRESPEDLSTEWKSLTEWEILQGPFPPSSIYSAGGGNTPRLSIDCRYTPKISACQGGTQSIDDFWLEIISEGSENGFSTNAWRKINSMGESLGIVSRQLLQDIEAQGVNQDEKEALLFLIIEADEISERVSLVVFPYIIEVITIEIHAIDWATREPILNAKIDFHQRFKDEWQTFYTNEEGKAFIPVIFHYDYSSETGRFTCANREFYTHIVSADGYIPVATRSQVVQGRSHFRDTEINNVHLGLSRTEIIDLIFLNKGSYTEPQRFLKNRSYTSCREERDDYIAWEQGYIGLNQYSIEEAGQTE